MTALDEAFAASMSEYSHEVAGADLTQVSDLVVTRARTRRRFRVAANSALTVAASLLVASAAWAASHSTIEPADQSTPTPQPSLTGALPEPSLEPLWRGGLFPVQQSIPGVFADSFSTSGLTAIDPPNGEYPEAFEMADWVWDEVAPGWSLQVWGYGDENGPANLYLASPGGTYFLVREIDEFAGAESWRIESWSAEPARAVIVGTDQETVMAARRLIDLRTGESLRSWGILRDGQTEWNDTVLAGGFEGGRSIQLEFTRTEGYYQDDLEVSPAGPVTVRVVGRDGSTLGVTEIATGISFPWASGAGGDGSTAILGGDGNAVYVLDLGTAEVSKVDLELEDGVTCFPLWLGPDATVTGECSSTQDVTTYNATWALPTGELTSFEEASPPSATLTGFAYDEGALVDDSTGAIVDLSRVSGLQRVVSITPLSTGVFAISEDSTLPNRLVLYDRETGASFTVVGDTVPNSRVRANVQSVVPLAELGSAVPGTIWSEAS